MFCASCFLFVLVLLYASFDVHYFLRVAFTIAFGRLFQKKVKVHDTTSIYGLCTTQDIDVFLDHMNDARFCREMDFARFSFYDRNGLYAEIRRRKGGVMLGASTIRFRRSIPIFSLYRVDTKMIYWDDKNVYLEQQFVTPRDGFVRAVALIKQAVVGPDVNELMEEVLKKTGGGSKPDMPPELQQWLDCLETTSARLRAKKD
ncbi:protein THEM6 [Anabrus simplex]|uniref:protein THEM6 n=1 Tax=Anabrus simplex TaxID=316456 RepID=UPI0035A38C8E